MNQLEFFVASTECERWQIRRCLRAIRVLDERIEYSLAALQTITEYRNKYLVSSSSAVAASAAHGSGPHTGRGGRKRGRPSDEDDGAVPSATAETETVTAEARMTLLKREFQFHQVTATRLARDRENYASLLVECGNSMRRCAATRLLQFQQTVENEKKPAA